MRRRRDERAPTAPPPPVILEVVYAIEGVAEARVWEWEKSVAVGVRPMAGTCAPDLLRRVESQVVVVREPCESWTFGVLED